jgi:transcriptional regulator NrdR family protein
MRCGYCGSNLHPISHCPHTHGGSSARVHLRCTYCGGRNHNYEGCTKHAGSGNMEGAVNVYDHGMFRTDA